VLCGGAAVRRPPDRTDVWRWREAAVERPTDHRPGCSFPSVAVDAVRVYKELALRLDGAVDHGARRPPCCMPRARRRLSWCRGQRRSESVWRDPSRCARRCKFNEWAADSR